MDVRSGGIPDHQNPDQRPLKKKRCGRPSDHLITLAGDLSVSLDGLESPIMRDKTFGLWEIKH